MAGKKTRKQYIAIVVFGTMSISSYVLLYTHQEWVTHHFTRGGVYAMLPIGTAFYFSLVHGTFVSCLMDAFGLRAAKKPTSELRRHAEGASHGEVQP